MTKPSGIFTFIFICICLFLTGFILLKKYVQSYTAIEIAFITNNDYAPHLGASMASILKNSAIDEKFNFYILESNLSDENKDNFKKLKKIKGFNLKFIPIDRQRFNQLNVTKTALEAYYKYVLAEVLPDKNKILYLDADTIVLGSLKKLWETDITNHYAAGVQNKKLTPSGSDTAKYINTGVILFNLQKMREDNITALLFKNTLKSRGSVLLKSEYQNVLNSTFQDKILFIPDKYNRSGNATLKNDAVIVHYGIDKPWKGRTKNFELYYTARQMTPWAYTEDAASFKGKDWQSIMNYNKDKTRVCRQDNKMCGTLHKSISVSWDDGTKEVFVLDFDGKYISFGGKHAGQIILVKHPLWEDEVILNENRACRLSQNDCGDIVSHTQNTLHILWDDKNEESFLLKNNAFYWDHRRY